MIFPRKLDLRAAQDKLQMIQEHINGMQELLEETESRLEARLRERCERLFPGAGEGGDLQASHDQRHGEGADGIREQQALWRYAL